MDKMDGMTMNIEQANVEKLRKVFPEVFADGKVDFDKLQGLLGHYIAGRICAMSLQRVDFFLVEKTYEMSVNINRMIERGIYETFHVDGNEAEVLTDSYFELYRLLGTDGTSTTMATRYFPGALYPGIILFHKKVRKKELFMEHLRIGHVRCVYAIIL